MATDRRLNDKALERALTPLRQQILDEEAAEQAANHAAARQRKRNAIAKYLQAKPAADAEIASAEADARAAEKAALAAHEKYIAARGRFDAVYGELSAVTEAEDRIMRASYDPAIDAFLDELATLKAATPDLYRTRPDPRGPFKDTNGNAFADNRAAIEASVRAISNVQDLAELLKTNPDVDDVAAEIDRLRKTIPEA
jgi:hypothetical protein